MRVLLDENVPIQALPILRRTLRGHDIEHVEEIGWKSKKDRFLLPDAVKAGYDVFVTKDINQLSDPDETQIIRKAGMHHVRFRQDEGVAGFARAVGSVVAAMPDVMDDLVEADGQRLVSITKFENKKRHELTDPGTNPPPYWRRSG